MKKKLKNALNYTGGKFDVLEQIIPLFPNSSVFIDLFGGSGDVAINIENYDTIIFNEKQKEIVELFVYFQENNTQQIIKDIELIINKYNLDATNKESYYKLREDYNKNKSPLLFYVLICHSFCNQVRFNKNKEFNLPFGNRTFNESMKKRLPEYINRIKNIKLLNMNYCDLYELITGIESNKFVYCDPPYLITEAQYNADWNEDDEYQLLRFLDNLNNQGIKFGLSNVIEHKGKTNNILIEWSKKYNVHYINKKYKNYRSNPNFITREVYICNY